MPFGLWTRVGQKHHVLGGVHNGATWRIPLNRPVRRRCGLFVKLLWKLAIAKPTFECDDIRISESMDQFLSEIQTSCFTQVTNVTFEHNFSVSQLIVLRSFTGGGAWHHAAWITWQAWASKMPCSRHVVREYDRCWVLVSAVNYRWCC